MTCQCYNIHSLQAEEGIGMPLAVQSLTCQCYNIHSLQAEEGIGMPLVFTLVDAAKTWINDNVLEQSDEGAVTEDTQASYATK